MSVPRSSDVSKHLSRTPKRPGIALPISTAGTQGRDDQRSVATEGQILTPDFQAIKETKDAQVLKETH